jgi:MFS family permease
MTLRGALHRVKNIPTDQMSGRDVGAPGGHPPASSAVPRRRCRTGSDDGGDGRDAFLLLWIADAISKAGSRVTTIAVPLIAIDSLHASAMQVGWLAAASTAAFALVGLPAGVIADRVSRHRILVGTDLARATVLLSIPVAAALHALTLTQLYIVASAHGLCTVLFDTAHQSFVPDVVDSTRLVGANSRLGVDAAAAATVGPVAGGWLIQLVSAAAAVLVDAISFVGSAICVWLVPAPRWSAPRARGHGWRQVWEEAVEGVRFVVGHRTLRPIALTAAGLAFFDTMLAAVILLFLSRDVGLPALAIGGLFSTGGVGAMAGAIVSARFARRLDCDRAIWSTAVLSGLCGLSIAMTGRGLALGYFVIGAFGSNAALVVFNVTQLSYRQTVTPRALLGRMNATMRVLVWGPMPVGALLGGVVGSAAGLRFTVLLALAGKLVAALPLLRSPARSARRPEPS